MLASIDTYLKTHGKSYVAAELEYATHNSTKNGGFPAFLKRSLENGWGTEDLKVRQAAQKEQRILERRQKERDLEALRAEQELLADIEKWDRKIDQKVQETLECISPTELNRFKTDAWEQAEKKTPSLKGQTSQVLAAAKEKLSTLVMTAKYSKLADADLKEAIETIERAAEVKKGAKVIRLRKKA
ncbi:hypothetical protein [Desulfosarcina ovata]|uniref:Uncharacterized protein n=1 Tax=Desulfosarcina ovata subsp. ovata TaxID=2752305 RepID=A0A5K8A6R5_9BACT|nr:hypothetical protein [Desulfosarcina ovata]BBO88207.1 hypothetical protein DSCOOX_13870 [Desulfosarcina ovata subsp. ovata]